jgi:hypothetical protein
MIEGTFWDKLRWGLFRFLSNLGWCVCPEPHKSNLDLIWCEQMDAFHKAVKSVSPEYDALHEEGVTSMTDNNTTDDVERRLEVAKQRYLAAAHGMQTGVALRPNDKDQTPKHLRVGVNVVMSDLGAVCQLLVEKGVFTEVELHEKLAEFMEAERDSQQSSVGDRYGFGTNVKLY